MLTLIFASPGTGKTTYACKLAYLEKRRKLKTGKGYDYIFLNFQHQVPGCRVCSLDKIGTWTFPRNSLVIADEGGIEYNNRKFKSFPEYAINYYKKIRHYGVDMVIISQEVDIEITLLRLMEELWLMYKIGPWTISRSIRRKIVPDKENHDIKAGYFFASVLSALLPFLRNWKLTFRPFYYKFFDSWECDDLPVKDFAETEIDFPIRKSASERCKDMYSRATARIKKTCQDTRCRLQKAAEKIPKARRRR